MIAVLDLIMAVLRIYTYLIVAMAILSWLLAFGIVNQGNQFVNSVAHFLQRITDPVLRHIRRYVPSLGGIDVSTIVLLLGIFFLQSLIVNYAYPAVRSAGL